MACYIEPGSWYSPTATASYHYQVWIRKRLWVPPSEPQPQFLSGGHFILGIGAGWKEDEYKAYGYDFPPASTRVEELDEAIQIIKAMWHEKQATVQGKHYHVVDAWCEPKPNPIPTLMIGAFKPRVMRLAALPTGGASPGRDMAQCSLDSWTY